jgi:hypothetical protein
MHNFASTGAHESKAKIPAASNQLDQFDVISAI